eukprot:g19997.t1
MTMKPLALALAAFAAGSALSTTVFAADLTSSYEPPAYSEPSAAPTGWTGAYVGLHAGTGSEKISPFSGDKEFMGGVHGGYNTEINGVVVGGEAELSHLGDTEVDVPGGELKERYRIAAKGKVGAPLGSTLVYGTAGLAMTSLRDTSSAEGPDGWKPGWLVGAGVEQKFNDKISGRIEYNYTRTNDVRSFDGVETSESDVSDHTIKAGEEHGVLRLGCFEPQKFQVRKLFLEDLAARSDLADHAAARIEVIGSLGEDGAHEVEPVLPSVMGHGGLGPVLGREDCHRLVIDIGGIGDDEVEGLARQRCEEIPLVKIDLGSYLMFGDIDRRHLQRIGRQVNRVYHRMGEEFGGQHRKASRTGADVGGAFDGHGIRQEGGSMGAQILAEQDLADMRAGHDHPLVHVKADALDIGMARQIGGWLAGGDAGLDPLGEQTAFGRQQPGIQERIQRIDRQVERIEQEKGRVVARGGGSMAIAEIGGVEARDGIAPIIAQRHQFFDDLGQPIGRHRRRSMRDRGKRGKPRPKRGEPEAAGKRVTLPRALSKLGFCSRTQAEALIGAGRVAVDGRIVTDTAAWLDLSAAKITVDGEVVAAERPVYLALNKPRGLVTTRHDPQGRPTVFTCFAHLDHAHLSPVGRLDKASEGLLLFTNDTVFAQALLDPKTHVAKTYHVQIDRVADERVVEALAAGVEHDGEMLRARSVRTIREGGKTSWLEVVLTEGRNRQIRRMLETLDIACLRLVRVAIGPLLLGDLEKGAVRQLADHEVEELRQLAGL